MSWGLLFQSALAADVSRSIAALPVSLSVLTQTQSTDFEIDMGGRKRIQRQYDSEGALVEQQVTDLSQHPPRIEKLVIKRDPEVWVRTVLTGETLIRREEERYGAPGELFKREIIWSSNEDGVIDRKALMEYEGIDVHTTEYEKESGGQWKQVVQKLESAFDSAPAGNRDYGESTKKAVRRLKTPRFAHLSCLKDKYPNADAVCLEALLNGSSSFEAVLKLGADHFSLLDCKDRFSPVYYLKSHYRIDTSSCFDSAGQEAIKAAAEKAFFGGVSCLSEVNSDLALRFSTYVSASNMTIRCSGNEISSETQTEELCKGSSNSKKKDCRDFIEFHSKSSAGAYLGGHEMHLFGADPCRYPAVRNDPKLEQTIFHETLHAMRLEKSGEHNSRPPDLGDAVFGCEALCGGNPKRLTREGCEACILVGHEKERNKVEGKLQFCQKLPSASLRREVAKWRYFAKLVASCAANSSARDCGALYASPEFQENCSKKSGLSNKCKKRLYSIASQGLLGLSFTSDVYKVFESIYGNEPTLSIEAQKPWVYKETPKNNRSGKELFLGQLVSSFCAQVASLNDDEAESFAVLRKSYDTKVGKEAEGYRSPFVLKGSSPVLFRANYGKDEDEFKNARIYCEKFLPFWSKDIGSEEF